MDEGYIDISGLDKVEVLITLYSRSRPQGRGFMHFDPASLTIDEARAALSHGYVDYLKGRVIKMDFRRDLISPYLYDRDLGSGSAARAIATLRRA